MKNEEMDIVSVLNTQSTPVANSQLPAKLDLQQEKSKTQSHRSIWMWKIGFAVLIILAVGIYVLSKYAKKDSNSIKPTIDKIEIVYTSPTPLPTIMRKIGDRLDYRNLQTDTSSWKEYKKEVGGLLITFKYPKQYGISRWGQGMPAEFDSLILKNNDIVVEFSRPILTDGVPYIRLDDNLSLIEGVLRNNDSWITRTATVVREIQTKSKKVVRIEYEDGWLSGPAYGPSSETYVIRDSDYLFTFINHNLIPLEEFIAIIDSFKVEKCLIDC